MRKVSSDPSLWLLLVLNLYCIYYFNQHPEGFKTVVWIYWIQSILIGFFNFLDLLTMKNGQPSSFMINDKPYDGSKTANGCAALFFLFHYNVFHLVYAIFILIQVKGSLDLRFLLLSTIIIIIECVMGFVRNKRMQQQQMVNVGFVFVMPYLRIIPMHLMILLPGFLGMNASIIFLILKSITDVIMYLVAHNIYARPVSRTNSITSSQIP